MTALVVGGDGNVNPVEGGVRVAESDHGDVHVGSLGQALVVKTGVAHDDKAGLEELLGVVIGKGTGNPLATEVVSTGVGGELEDGTLSVLAGGHNLLKSVSYNQITNCELAVDTLITKRAHSKVKSFVQV